MKSVPPNLLPRFTEEEYLAFDRAAEYKNEFFGGAIRPMPNVSLRHSEIGVRVAAALFGERRSSGRHVFGCDARVRTPKSRSYLYPDAAVVCGAMEQEQGDILLNPVVIVEILSPGTSDYDHGRKFAMYREIASLRDYVMVHTDSACGALVEGRRWRMVAEGVLGDGGGGSVAFYRTQYFDEEYLRRTY